jgi:hypothetical protein
LSSATPAYPRAARQKPTSTVSGCPPTASCTSCARAVDDGSVRPRHRRDRSSKVDVPSLQLPDVAGQPHG